MLNSLKDKLESQLAFFKSIPSNRNQMEESKMTLIKGIVQDFVETSLQSGASGEAVRKELADMYANDILVSREVYEWASELVDAVSKPTSQPDQDEVVKRKPEKRPLFCKDTVYHSCLCCYAVSTCTAANYNEFFLKDFPQHLLEEVSFSRSQDRKDVDRYLIARQGKTYYVALRSEPLLTNWGKEFASFEKGLDCYATDNHYKVCMACYLLMQNNGIMNLISQNMACDYNTCSKPVNRVIGHA